MLKLRPFFIVFTILILLGCTASHPPPRSHPQIWSQSPNISDFPSSGLSYSIGGYVDDIRNYLIGTLSYEQWPFNQYIEGRSTYVITVYVEEGKIPEFKRKTNSKESIDDTKESTNDNIVQIVDTIPVFYLWQPKNNNGRVQRVALMMRLRDDSKEGKKCTEVFLSWKVESRGLREETWRTTEDDEATQPMLNSVITRRLGNLDLCH